MRLALPLLLIGILLLVSGCASPAATTNNEPIITTQGSEAIPAPGPPIAFCNTDTPAKNQECFEDAFANCDRAIGEFWTTSDGGALLFESLGLDTAGNCSVRVSVKSDSSAFFGKTANCTIPKMEAMGEHTTAFFDAYSIGTETCTGTYVDAIQKTAPPAEAAPVPEPTSSTPPATTSPQPSVKEFSIVVNDTGVVGTHTFTVKKGDTVKFTITSDTQSVSFNGEQVIAPATKGLPADQYIFDTDHLAPGKGVTVEFVADSSFEFGVYWPGPSVLKGKANVVVESS